jgi:hypothetical protein
LIYIRLFALILSGPKNLVHNIPWIALAQIHLQRVVDEINQIEGCVRVILDLILFGNTAKNLAEAHI